VVVDMVEERIAAGGADAATLANLIAESLVDLIMMVPQEERAKLMAEQRPRVCPLGASTPVGGNSLARGAG
jgi:hypothetical protein